MQDVSRGEGRTVLFVSHNMESVQSLCTKGLLLEYGRVAYQGNISDTIGRYLEGEVPMQRYVNISPDTSKQMELLRAEIKPSVGEIFTVSKPIELQMEVRINQPVVRLFTGFSLFSARNTPIARVDFNDFNGLRTLEPGTYIFNYKIPAYTLSNGSYRICMDLEDYNVKCYVEGIDLSFDVILDEASTVNFFNEKSPKATSVIRANWLESLERKK